MDFYYDPKHVIFSRLSVSADLESRICVVWLPSLFCELGLNFVLLVSALSVLLTVEHRGESMAQGQTWDANSAIS